MMFKTAPWAQAQVIRLDAIGFSLWYRMVIG